MPFIVPADEKVLIKMGEGQGLEAPLSELNIFVWNVYKGQKAHIFENDFRKHGSGKDLILRSEEHTSELQSH